MAWGNLIRRVIEVMSATGHLAIWEAHENGGSEFSQDFGRFQGHHGES